MRGREGEGEEMGVRLYKETALKLQGTYFVGQSSSS